MGECFISGKRAHVSEFTLVQLQAPKTGLFIHSVCSLASDSSKIIMVANDNHALYMYKSEKHGPSLVPMPSDILVPCQTVACGSSHQIVICGQVYNDWNRVAYVHRTKFHVFSDIKVQLA